MNEFDATWSKKKLANVLHYFPLILGLRKIYASLKIASSISWHNKGCIKDKMLKHLVDSLSWKIFIDRYLDFVVDVCNIKLGLAIDGFNVF